MDVGDATAEAVLQGVEEALPVQRPHIPQVRDGVVEKYEVSPVLQILIVENGTGLMNELRVWIVHGDVNMGRRLI